jgi:phosphatidylinositol alpha-1,6-mannosyltransferase
MQTLYIASHEFPPFCGGIATFTIELSQVFHHLGYPMHLLVPKESSLPKSFSLNPATQVEVERLPIGFNHGLFATWTMAKAFKRHEKALARAVLVITEPGPIRAVYLANRLLNFKLPRIWLVVHGSELLRGLRSPLWRIPLRYLLQRAEKIATVSRFNINLLVQRYHLDKKSVTLLPLAAPSAVAEKARQTDPDKRPPKGRLRLITVARLHPRKGQDQVLLALAKLPVGILARIEYQIIGSGRNQRYQQQLQKIVSEHKLPVCFLGEVDAPTLLQHYAQADIFILTSRRHRDSVEGFGLVYLEANCFGLPVIGTHTGGTADAIIDGETGILLDNNSPALIANAIQKLVANEGLRKKMSVTGRARALQRSWESTAATFL